MDPQMGKSIFFLKDTDFEKLVGSKTDTEYLRTAQLQQNEIKE